MSNVQASRRAMLKASAAASVLAVTNPAKSYARIMGANEDLRMAVIGFKGRGRALISAINQAAGATLVGLCDVDEKILASHEPDNKDLLRTTDLREFLERDDIDAVASATPNHWHALLTCLACEKGKHLYIEKPISHNMFESQRIVEIARKNDSIVQCGFQNRSDTGLLTFFDKLLQGKYGTVRFVHGTCHRQRATIGKLDQALKVSSSIDYEMWLGPATDVPLLRPKLHYDWHWDFNTGNGDVGNQGPHEWDMMNWALGNPESLPTQMVAAGNRFGWGDAGNTPNVMACAGITNGIPFCFEVMDLKGGRGAPHGKGVGVIVETDKGRFVGGRGGGQFKWNDGKTEQFKRDETQGNRDGTRSHMQNFVEAVQQADRQGLRSECAVAARSSAMAHMANVSYQLGKPCQTEQLESAFSENVQQRDMIARLRESVMLFEASGLATGESQPWLLGPSLSFNNDAYRFESDGNLANPLMTRQYRSGFEMPTV